MSNIIGLLDLGRGALLTHQKSIYVTGHNIANVNTPGYTRQRVNLAAGAPLTSSPGQLGTGVIATEIQRIYDRYLNVQINAEQQSLGRWEAQKNALDKVEFIFNESEGYGLNQAMSEFWNAWQDLATSPDGHTQRVALLSSSEYLTTTLNRMSRDLSQHQTDLDSYIAMAADEINSITAQISTLNRKIVEVEVGGQNANDLKDRRDALIKDLSQLIDINAYEDNRGSIDISTARGRMLVENEYAWQLTTRANVSGHQNVMWVDPSGNLVDITASISEGRLKGWLDVRDQVIPDYLNRLDTLTGSIIADVNTLHAGGFDLNSNPGQLFFTGNDAATVQVDANLLSNPHLIAASATASGVPADNGNAIAIANLQHLRGMSGGIATYDDFYNSLVSDVGSDVQSATDYYEHQSTVTANLDLYRESISGVSLDEEMLNLIKFQHAYDAAAKLVSTVDEMINTVMNMV